MPLFGGAFEAVGVFEELGFFAQPPGQVIPLAQQAFQGDLDYDLTIDTGIVDGSAYDGTAKGPVPNLKKGAPPPPTPGLWQIHGLAKPGSFSLITVASVKATDRRQGRLNVTSQGGALTVTESSGCGRTARLTKG